MPNPIAPNACSCTALRKATRRMAQLYDAALAPCGLRSTQYATLVEIDRHPEAAPTLSELAELMVMDRSTLGQNLRPLERDGLIAIQPDPNDRRRRHLVLTEFGRDRLAKGIPLWSAAQARFEAAFGAQRAADLRDVLLTIANNPQLSGEPA
jgi:DNA-binding MarR family transcriptional regulator